MGRNVKHGITKEIRDKNIFGLRLTATMLWCLPPVIWCRNNSIQKMDIKSWAGFCTRPLRCCILATSTVQRQNVQARTHCPVSTLSIALPCNLTDCQTDSVQCFSCKVWWHGERIAEGISIKTLFYLMKISKQNCRFSSFGGCGGRGGGVEGFPRKPLSSD